MASGGMALIKCLLFFFNFIFWLSGLALIVVGAVIKAKSGDFVEISSSSLTTGPVFLIIIGVIVAIVGFLGCCGAYKENYCMVTTFAILLAIIFILEIAAGAVAYAYKDKLEGYVKEGLEKGVDKYATDKVFRKAMDKAQKDFGCCGVDKYTDYFKASNASVFPESCCKKGETDCPTSVSAAKKNPSKLNSKGCLSELEKYLKDHIVVVGGVGIGIAFIQLIGIIFACCLMRSIKKEYEVM